MFILSIQNKLVLYVLVSSTDKVSKWVLVSSTGKVSDGCIRDLGFNHCLHQKLIGVSVWW